jgi:carboxymethylenebutenolidase
MGRTIHLTATDGHAFGAYRADPAAAAKGVIVVVQEIFGVNRHIRDVADGFAADGFTAVAPQLFDRVERDVELGYDAPDFERGRALRTDLGFDVPILDIAAAAKIAEARGLKAAVVGYCFGGGLAWLSAARIPGLAAAVGYYGPAAAFRDEAPTCPVMLHYGERDSHIPVSDAADLKALYPEIETHVYPADHGFNCDLRASYDADSATIARSRTLSFLEKSLG